MGELSSKFRPFSCLIQILFVYLSIIKEIEVMKKFDDIKWKAHSVIPGGVQGVLTLDNGTFFLIVAGPGLYSTPKAKGKSHNDFDSFEVAVFIDDEMSGEPGGWQDRGEINKLIEEHS